MLFAKCLRDREDGHKGNAEDLKGKEKVTIWGEIASNGKEEHLRGR